MNCRARPTTRLLRMAICLGRPSACWTMEIGSPFTALPDARINGRWPNSASGLPSEPVPATVAKAKS